MNNLGESNLSYHADKEYLSSSGLKCILKSSEEFFNKYIQSNMDVSSADHFAEGSLVHTLILEPDKISDYAIYPGMRKQGAVWEAFKKENASKTIVSYPQMLRCERLVKSYNCMPTANSLIRMGIPEHNMTSELLDVKVKARADYILPDQKIIVDVKTTSMPSDPDLFRQTIDQYSYQLSAALYCQIAFDTYGELFDFYWLVLSKDDFQCHVYKASSDTLLQGTVLVTKALVKYKKCFKSGLWIDQQEKINYSNDEYEVLEI